MSKKAKKRAEIVEKLAAHFLVTGLGDTGLRRLAEVADTSDRMLLYYFENKEEILAEVLAAIGGGFSQSLDSVFGTGLLKPARAVDLMWGMLKDDAYAQQLRLWLDLASRASRGDPFFGPIVDQMAEGWISWLEAMIDVADSEKRALAVLIMGALDGQLILFPTDLSKGDAAMKQFSKMLEKV